MSDLLNRIDSARVRVNELVEEINLPRLKERLAELTKNSENPNLWDNPKIAQDLMRSISQRRQEIEEWEKMISSIEETKELIELDDESLLNDLIKETASIEKKLQKLEMNTLLSGRYDKGNALLSINAGAGGTDSQDWAAMLQRMYLRWAEQHDYSTAIMDMTEGEEAGIKSITISVEGRYAYGFLRAEKGVHRLVRLSPFDSNNRRHTSFAQVEVLPQVENAADIEINPSDLKIETFRAGGAGGQSVQKNDTAVRITHIPTGVAASCQNERSQTQNRENALKVLKARLVEIVEREAAEEIAELRGAYQKAEWGSQIRSYVLHPYQMVKDHRTNHEMGNAQNALDGDLDSFIEAFLRSQVGK